MINNNERELRSKRIQVMVTPTFKQELENFLGPIPMSRFFSILAEQAMKQDGRDSGEEELGSYKIRRREGDGGLL